MVDKYGLKAATRFGLGILRSNAIAKNNQHKNSPLNLKVKTPVTVHSSFIISRHPIFFN